MPNPTVSQALNALQTEFPGVQVYESGGRVRAVYGVPMTAGLATGTVAGARQAAETWLAEYAGAFGEPSPNLVEDHYARLKSGKTVFTYRQRIDGVPVEDSLLRVLVLNEPVPRVTYVAGRVAQRPPGGLGAPLIGASTALLSAKAHPIGATLTTWEAPELVARYPDSASPPPLAVLLWRCGGADHALFKHYDLYVSSTTAQVVDVTNRVMQFADVTGTVKGHQSPGVKPATYGVPSTPCSPTHAGTLDCPNPLALAPLKDVRVEAVVQPGGGRLTTYTDQNGDFLFPATPSQTLQITASMHGSAWEVKDYSQATPPPVPVIQVTANPGQTSVGVLTFNESGSEFTTAHVNASVHMRNTWRYYRDRVWWDGPVEWLDDPVEVRVNHRDELFFPVCGGDVGGGRVVRFSWSDDSGLCGNNLCANAAYSTVVTHEYGHILLFFESGIGSSLFADRAVHEGFADSLAHLVHDTDTIGTNHCRCACESAGNPPCCLGAATAHIRRPLVTNLQYPDCPSTFDPTGHFYGQMLSAIWLRILGNLRESSCSPPPPPGCSDDALEAARQLHVDWALATVGGQPCTEVCGPCPLEGCACFNPPPPFDPIPRRIPAHPGTLIEVLVVDDNDGNICNGTPHALQICKAFACHSICLPGGTCSPSPCASVQCPDPPCGGTRPGPAACYADCDRDGVLSASDLACFQMLLLSRDRSADCDRDGVPALSDMVCFQRAFGMGCPAGETPRLGGTALRGGDR